MGESIDAYYQFKERYMLINNYERAICIYASRIARKTNFRLSKEDAAQELRIKLWRSIDNYDSTRGSSEEAYFNQILFNYHKTLITQTMFYCIQEETLGFQAWQEMLERRGRALQNHQFIWELIESLESPKLKLILKLHLEGYTQTAISKKMKLSQKRVGFHYRRAIKEIKYIVREDTRGRI